MKNDICIHYKLLHIDKGTTYLDFEMLSYEEQKEHPLYKCKICSPTYFKYCENYKPYYKYIKSD